MRGIVRIGAALAAFLICGTSALAQQSFPTKPVRLLIPYPPGGAVDILGRTLGDELSKKWGQPVIIENRPGAGGTIASQVVAKAAPDGYTLVIVASGHAINPYIYSNLPYDTFKDFRPISLLGSSPNIMLVATSSPYKTLADVLAAARAKPGSLSYGMAGIGTSTHLAGELLKYMTKVDIAAVSYKGGAPIINDLLGGHIPLSFNNIPESIGQIRGGNLRPLGVTSATRSPVLPDVPTIAEAGYPKLTSEDWAGFLLKAGTPPATTARLNAAINKALATDKVRESLAKLGVDPGGGTPQEFGVTLHSEIARWGKIVNEAGIKIAQ